MNEYRTAWSKATGYYSTHRNSKEEIYKSEEHFLSRILRPEMSVLDVGCAAGGFYNILRGLVPDVSYTGVDFSEEMVETAKKTYPDARFRIMSGESLDFTTEFDLIFCSGVMHLDLNWRKILKECWRLTGKYFLFDIRLVEGISIENIKESYQKIALEGNWDGRSIVPYILLNVKDFFGALGELKPLPGSVEAFGYFHNVADTAIMPHDRVCMTMICLEKTKEKRVAPLKWDVPIPLPYQLRKSFGEYS